MPCAELASAYVGAYALFGGGQQESYYGISVVNAYSRIVNIQVFPGTKYKLNTMENEQTSSDFQELEFSIPLNGYLKIQNADIS